MRRSVFFVLWCAAFRISAEPMIGAVRLSQTTAVIGTPTAITIVTSIVDPSLIPNSVNLLRLNADGTATVLGTLNDSGVNGDAVAGDQIFTTTVMLDSAAAASFQLQVSVAFKGALQRVKSGIVIVYFQSSNAPETALATLSKAILAADIRDALKYFADTDKATSILSALDVTGRQRLANAFAAARLVKSTQQTREFAASWTAANNTQVNLAFVMWPNIDGTWVIGSW